MAVNEGVSNPAIVIAAGVVGGGTIPALECVSRKPDCLLTNNLLPASIEYKQRATEALRITDRFNQAPSLCGETFLPALRLHTFNFLADYPQATDADCIKELAHLQNTVAREVDFSKRVDLPTIGIEVEVPSRFLDLDTASGTQLREALETMGIPVSRERTGHHPTEFSLPPSYSAIVQSRMLHELRMMGVVPTDRSFASMHIGLGVRDDELSAKYKTADVATFFPLSDILTYAFVSPNRIRSRIFCSVKLKEGICLEDCAKEVLRLELRTARVMGDKTYRMLEEVQLVGALFLPTNQQYADLGTQFSAEYEALLGRYGLKPDMPDSYFIDPLSQEHAAQKVEEAEEYRQSFDAQLAAAEYIPGQQQRQTTIDLLRKQRAENLIDESRRLLHKYAQAVRVTSSIVD